MKTAKSISLTALFAVVVLNGTVMAQPRSLTPLRATVSEVTDNRTTGAFNSECKIELKFTGDPAADAGSVREVHLLEAKDELGRDLTIKKEEQSGLSSFNSGRSGGVLKTDVKLRNPSRNATTIKVLKGEVELFNPTEANGGLLTIKNVLQHPAEPIAQPELARHGVQVMYLTKEAYEAKKKELAQKAATDPASQKLADAFGGLFKGMFGGMMSDSKNSIQLYIQDPQKRIMDLKFLDGKGQPLKSRERWSSGEFNSTGLESPPPADTQLVIQLATPESVRSYPFIVENIALP